jgi:prepilin-type N-terminal cleavage/methylation domain-containing protein
MKRTAFTLIEILIVVAILAILAVVVIPTFASCTAAAKDSALAQDLGMLKRMVLVYKAQHLETSPGYPDGDKSQAPVEDVFTAQVEMASNGNGATAAVGTAGYKYGPYMERIPENPFNHLRTVHILGDAEAFPAEADNNHGWMYKPSTQEFRPDNTGSDETGKLYYNY